MTTTAEIRDARAARLATNPYDPHKHALMSHNTDGMPAGFLTLPDLGETQMLAMREGMDLLARVHDEEAVEEWIHDILTLVKDPDAVGLFLVNVVRGVAPILASGLCTDTDEGARELYRRFAFDAWSKSFTDGDAA